MAQQRPTRDKFPSDEGVTTGLRTRKEKQICLHTRSGDAFVVQRIKLTLPRHVLRVSVVYTQNEKRERRDAPGREELEVSTAKR